MDRDDLEDMGPIDYLVVEFPGSRMTGKGLPMLKSQGVLSEAEFQEQKRRILGT